MSDYNVSVERGRPLSQVGFPMRAIPAKMGLRLRSKTDDVVIQLRWLVERDLSPTFYLKIHVVSEKLFEDFSVLGVAYLGFVSLLVMEAH